MNVIAWLYRLSEVFATPLLTLRQNIFRTHELVVRLNKEAKDVENICQGGVRQARRET